MVYGCLAFQAMPLLAAEQSPDDQTVRMTAAELFAFADAARDRGDLAVAETAYRALSASPNLQIRSEARYRLGMMLADRQKRYADAAIEFRKILDESPDAAGVRLQLARMHGLLGNVAAAAREFRAVEAAGVPAEVLQAVRFYASVFEAQKPLGFSFSAALAPDTNVNRATRSETLGTVIGDFTLSDEARAQSGIGLQVRGQAYLRQGIAARARLLATVSVMGDLYRDKQFNDLLASVQIGPEIQSGKDRIYLGGQLSRRWYGGQDYNRVLGLSGKWIHPAGKRSQLTLESSLAWDKNQLNPVQDATIVQASLGYDRSFRASTGGGVSFFGRRSVARDPGFSLTSAGAGAYVFREFGPATAVLNVEHSRLEADERLLLYRDRRQDDRFAAGLSLTLRSLRLGAFAPMAKVRFERNGSTIEIYDFNRLSGEVGITAAF